MKQNNHYITNKILISSDHAGFKLKASIINYLKKRSVNMIDLGTFDKDISVDYPDFAKKLCKKILNNNFGILVCGTGIGMSIMANRYKNVRASLVHNNYTARFAREHNNANVLTLGARTLNSKKTIKLVNIFFKTKFLKGRHLRRINKFKYV